MIHLPRARASRQAVVAVLFALAAIAILALTWAVYHAGLSGDFLFDDFANLPALGATGPVDTWATFWRYITSGTADPTGRPLTLLTFLIDARDWPASPYPFKVTNVILHLLNGVLLGWVLWKLGRALCCTPSTPAMGAAPAPEPPFPSPAGRSWPEGPDEGSDTAAAETPQAPLPVPQAGWLGADAVIPPRLRRNPLSAEGGEKIWWPAIAALFGAGAWLLHPLLVSTTLYVVQREAMLPATLVLLGMLGWIASREALARGHNKRALVGMALSAWLCTVLAVLSKANGALLPILLLLVEWIVLSRRPLATPAQQRTHHRAVALFLIVPSVLVLAYLLSFWPHSLAAPLESRGWSIGERLLTEARVLTDYLRLLFIPHAHSSGLFNDAFPISTGWLNPRSTLACVVFIAALIGTGFALRKRHPAIALALLFYFAAQLMESGWIPLELYFEHRNYLPAMLLFWPIGLALGQPGTLRILRVLAAALILTVLASLTAQRAALWGDGFRQAQVWATINPDSARAQTNAALYDMAHDRPQLAAARLQLAMPQHPDDVQLPINLVGAECKLGAVQPATLRAVESALQRTRLGGAVAFHWFNDALGMAQTKACGGLDFAALQASLDAARRNPHWRDEPGRQQDLDHLQGQLDLAEGKPDAALQSFNHALAAAPGPDTALEQAAYFGARGYPKLGLAHLAYFATLPSAAKPRLGMPRIHAWVLRMQGWWPHELAYLRHNLQTDADAKAAHAVPHA